MKKLSEKNKKTFIHWLVLVCMVLTSFPEVALGARKTRSVEDNRSHLRSKRYKTVLDSDKPTGVAVTRKPNIFGEFVAIPLDKRSFFEKHRTAVFIAGGVAVVSGVIGLGTYFLAPLFAGCAAVASWPKKQCPANETATSPSMGGASSESTVTVFRREATLPATTPPFQSSCSREMEDALLGGNCYAPTQPGAAGGSYCAGDGFWHECNPLCGPKDTFLGFGQIPNGACSAPGTITMGQKGIYWKCKKDGDLAICQSPELPSTSSSTTTTTRKPTTTTTTRKPTTPTTTTTRKLTTTTTTKAPTIFIDTCPDPTKEKGINGRCNAGKDQYANYTPGDFNYDKLPEGIIRICTKDGWWRECTTDSPGTQDNCPGGTVRVGIIRPCDLVREKDWVASNGSLWICGSKGLLQCDLPLVTQKPAPQPVPPDSSYAVRCEREGMVYAGYHTVAGNPCRSADLPRDKGGWAFRCLDNGDWVLCKNPSQNGSGYDPYPPPHPTSRFYSPRGKQPIPTNPGPSSGGNEFKIHWVFDANVPLALQKAIFEDAQEFNFIKGPHEVTIHVSSSAAAENKNSNAGASLPLGHNRLPVNGTMNIAEQHIQGYLGNGTRTNLVGGTALVNHEILHILGFDTAAGRAPLFHHLLGKRPVSHFGNVTCSSFWDCTPKKLGFFNRPDVLKKFNGAVPLHMIRPLVPWKYQNWLTDEWLEGPILTQEAISKNSVFVSSAAFIDRQDSPLKVYDVVTYVKDSKVLGYLGGPVSFQQGYGHFYSPTNFWDSHKSISVSPSDNGHNPDKRIMKLNCLVLGAIGWDVRCDGLPDSSAASLGSPQKPPPCSDLLEQRH